MGSARSRWRGRKRAQTAQQAKGNAKSEERGLMKTNSHSRHFYLLTMIKQFYGHESSQSADRISKSLRGLAPASASAAIVSDLRQGQGVPFKGHRRGRPSDRAGNRHARRDRSPCALRGSPN